MLLSVKNTLFSVTMSLFEIFHIHFFFFFKLVLLRWKNIYLCKANDFLRQFLGFWYKFANASDKSSLANKECFLAILFYNNFVVLMSFSFFEVNYESILNQSLRLGEFLFVLTCFNNFAVFCCRVNIMPLSGNLRNGQTYSNNSLAFADILLECVWPFCGVGA